MMIRRVVAAAAIVVGLASDGPGACPEGDYAVVGDPLLASPNGALTGDVVTIADGSVSIASGGPAVPARIHGTSRGTLVRAAWFTEGTQRVAARLRAIVDPSCASLHGRFRIRGVRAVRRFDAARTGGSAPTVCGGIAGLPCEAGEVCELPKGECRSTDLQGVCVPLPTACPDLRAPVCGCDGTTYGNECERMTAGAQLAHAGPCGPPCDDACGCEKSFELPAWCGMLMCPACGCRWSCDAGYCDVHVATLPLSVCK